MRKTAAIVLALTLAGTPACAQQGLAWTSRTTGAGTGLVLARPGGDVVLTLACVRGTREVQVTAPSLKPNAGDQFVLQFGDKVVPFSLKPQTLKSGKVLEAYAKAFPELLAAIAGGAPIRGVYGDSRIGPYAGPPKAMGQAFSDLCGPLV